MLLDLLSKTGMELDMNESGKRKRLGDLLLASGLIQKEQLDIAMKVQKKPIKSWGIRL